MIEKGPAENSDTQSSHHGYSAFGRWRTCVGDGSSSRPAAGSCSFCGSDADVGTDGRQLGQGLEGPSLHYFYGYYRS
jgi:hypothetical protein